MSNASHTSDEGITPVSSRVELNEPLKHPLDEALSGEEVDALKIKDEDLRMVVTYMHLVNVSIKY